MYVQHDALHVKHALQGRGLTALPFEARRRRSSGRPVEDLWLESSVRGCDATISHSHSRANSSKRDRSYDAETTSLGGKPARHSWIGSRSLLCSFLPPLV